MKSLPLIAGAGTLLAQTLLGATAGNWPQWRGPAATGTAADATPPLTWSETQNVKWKYRIPGYGTSTPIIWGDQVFVVSAESTGKKSDVAKEPPKDGPAPGAGAPPTRRWPGRTSAPWSSRWWWPGWTRRRGRHAG